MIQGRSFKKIQQGVQGGQRMRRTTGDEEINRNDGAEITDNLGAPVKRPTGDGTGTTGDDHLGGWNRSICVDEGSFHVFGNWPGDVNAIGMPW